MSQLTVQLINGTGMLNVADTDLVFNGQDFVPARDALYCGLYTVSVDALSLPYKDIAAQMLTTQVILKAAVVNYSALAEPVTDPTVIAEADPSGGQCVCGVTCNGTRLSFVIVQQEP